MLFSTVQCIVLASCWHNQNDISFKYTNNEEFYTMDARFSKGKTRIAERYMNEKIGNENNISFVNTKTNGEVTLQDASTFYMKKSPGHIFIKMNRLENSDDHFHSIQEMCRGMKDVVMK